jgi:predicted ATPase
MVKKKNKKRKNKKRPSITKISVSGYKSIARKQTIEIRPLTVLAGANSTGKSSIIQPFLLLKQTLEETFDPGPILLSGPIVNFSSTSQILSRKPNGMSAQTFSIGIGADEGSNLTLRFVKDKHSVFKIKEMCFNDKEESLTFRLGMRHQDIRKMIGFSNKKDSEFLRGKHFSIVRNRCFLGIELQRKQIKGDSLPSFVISPTGIFDYFLRNLIHLPGLRGIPSRMYPMTAVGKTYPGTFEKYVASIIHNWQATKEFQNLKSIVNDLEKLGLTSRIAAKKITDSHVEIKVGRFKASKRKHLSDMINIADVGLGICQVLPILVALRIAQDGQVVYIEQPELHLHPRAKEMLADILVDAANRGVRVVVETHSSLLLLGIRAAVASGNIPPEKVKLHWFLRSEDGITKVKSADLDKSGAFGRWPEDFGQVTLEAQKKYLDAAEKKLFSGG